MTDKFFLHDCAHTMTKIALLAVFGFLLTACTTPPEPIKIDEDLPGVKVSLEEAMRRADEMKARVADAGVAADMSAPMIASLNWAGEASEILSRLAVARGLKFKITGPQPRLALPVFIKLRNVSFQDALVAIADQLGQRADVVLHDDMLELRMRLY